MTVGLPCIVALRSVTYYVRLIHCVPSGRHNLARYEQLSSDRGLDRDYRTYDALAAAVFETGLPVRVDTIFCGRWGPTVGPL